MLAPAPKGTGLGETRDQIEGGTTWARDAPTHHAGADEASKVPPKVIELAT